MPEYQLEARRRQSTNTGKALLKLPEVANVLRVSVMTVRRLIRRRALASVRIGNQVLVRTTELDSYIERNTLQAVGGS